MARIFFLFLACAAVASPSLEARSLLNPINWFRSTDDAAPLPIASEADEAGARVLLDEAKVHLERDHLGAANRIFKRIVKEYPTTSSAGEALYLQARILMTKERWKKAFETFQLVVQGHPGFEQFDLVIGGQFECATALMEGARMRLFWVIPTFRQYSEAIRQFEQIVGNAPYSDYAPLSLMNMALIAQNRNKPEIAIDALDRLINSYPQSMLAPDAYYNLAVTYAGLVQGSEYDQGSTRQAISYYEDFLILFPQSIFLGEVEANLERMENLLSQSRLNLGNFFYTYRNNNTAALVFYNEAITIAPESDAAGEARERIRDIEAGVRPVSGYTILRKLLLAD